MKRPDPVLSESVKLTYRYSSNGKPSEQYVRYFYGKTAEALAEAYVEALSRKPDWWQSKKISKLTVVVGGSNVSSF